MMSKPFYNNGKDDETDKANKPMNIQYEIATGIDLETALDDDGHLVNHLQWSPKVAQILADTLEVTLKDEHYQVLAIVRQFFEQFQHSPATRPLIKYLQQQLPIMQISNQKLQQMFATGLVARHVNRIAGLPKPPNCL